MDRWQVRPPMATGGPLRRHGQDADRLAGAVYFLTAVSISACRATSPSRTRLRHFPRQRPLVSLAGIFFMGYSFHVYLCLVWFVKSGGLAALCIETDCSIVPAPPVDRRLADHSERINISAPMPKWVVSSTLLQRTTLATVCDRNAQQARGSDGSMAN